MNRNIDDFISIIVPCYNAGKAINELLDLLLNQTYKKYEVILVDDGSNDNTKDVINTFIYNNGCENMYHYYYKENGGVSSARNFGIEKSKGDYIVFLDSDDVIVPTMLEDLVINLFENDSDLVISNASIKKGENVTELPIAIKENEVNRYQLMVSIFSSVEAYKKYDFMYNFGRSVCCKLYKKSIIDNNNLRFDNRMFLFEDGFFNLNYLKYANKVSYILNSLYVYKIGKNNSERFRKNIIRENEYKIDQIKDFVGRNVELEEASAIFNIDLFFAFVKTYLKNDKLEMKYYTKVKLMKQEYKEKYCRYFNKDIFKYLNIKKKILYLFIKMHLYHMIIFVL